MCSSFRRIALPEIKDSRGCLMFAEEGRHIPFPVKRIFAIYGVPDGSARGGHAHRTQEQLIFMVAGECTAIIDDGQDRTRQHLTTPTEGLYVSAGTWLELVEFSKSAVCVALASGLFDESDYIRDREEFLALKSAA
jgi:dTDP-4-dehydrorhamnose 3,5-epimerase-like enzyme